MFAAALAVVVLLDPVGAAPAPSRVRAVSTSARALLTEATMRSPTVAQLVEALQTHRVFVFIDTRLDPTVPTGQTALLTSNLTARYLHIVLNPTIGVDRRIELLGHELQHALEIATAADVHDGASLRRHFADIGRELSPRGRDEKAYETEAAKEVELRVRRDLHRHGARP